MVKLEYYIWSIWELCNITDLARFLYFTELYTLIADSESGSSGTSDSDESFDSFISGHAAAPDAAEKNIRISRWHQYIRDLDLLCMILVDYTMDNIVETIRNLYKVLIILRPGRMIIDDAVDLINHAANILIDGMHTEDINHLADHLIATNCPYEAERCPHFLSAISSREPFLGLLPREANSLAYLAREFCRRNALI